MSEGGTFRRLINRSRPAALGLRRRILLIITLGSIALSLFLAITTFGLTRSNPKGATKPFRIRVRVCKLDRLSGVRRCEIGKGGDDLRMVAREIRADSGAGGVKPKRPNGRLVSLCVRCR